jgi:hypothetical protein
MKLASPLIRRMFTATPEDLAITVEQGVLEYPSHAYHVSPPARQSAYLLRFRDSLFLFD